MHTIDWLVMIGVLGTIVIYGILKTRKVDNTRSYLQGDKDLPWWTIGLSIMATQASAITFLSTPGKAYESGMDFVQFYFGMPIAIVLLCIFVLPIYYKLNVYTAYEYLEGRFDLKTRTLTAILFLIQRGMAAGITIYAPSIILSNILNWDLNTTIIIIGAVVIAYTVLGGTKAVSVTQKQQMIVILLGMLVAAVILVLQLPKDISFGNAVSVAGKMGKLEVIDFSFDPSNEYTVWTGLVGGVFLFLSYFGTDQSQVQRYLSGKSLSESRLGLLFNGIVKVPMQFSILFIGILVFMFFQFTQSPVHFNQANLAKLENTEYKNQLESLKTEHANVFNEKQNAIRTLISAMESESSAQINTEQTRVKSLLLEENAIRAQVDTLILQHDPNAKIKDDDYVFITFVTQYLPLGLIGLLLAVIFSAAMSSTSSELSAVATTTVVDLYRRSIRKKESDRHYLNASKLFTIAWGILALGFALVAPYFDNLIVLVNIIGSLFYGTILGVFIIAFFFKQRENKSLILGSIVGALLGIMLVALIQSNLNPTNTLIGSILGGLFGYLYIRYFFEGIRPTAVFIGAILAEISVLVIYALTYFEVFEISYLWLNLIGCVFVVFFALIVEKLMPTTNVRNEG
ncbi:MAG: sodium:solute symporter [Bacteroidota bacterium]